MEQSKAQGIGCLVLIAGVAAIWVYSVLGPQHPKFTWLDDRGNFAMTIPEGVDTASLPIAARKECGTRTHCSVYGWTKESEPGRGMPLLEAELATLAFRYDINRTTGFERSLWDCTRFPQPKPDLCLSSPE